MMHVMDNVALAIFCLLTFCAFKTVYADKLADDISASSDASKKAISNVHGKLDKNIRAVLKPLNFKEMTADDMLFRCDISYAGSEYEKSYKTKKAKCQKCYLQVKNKGDIQYAENCCKKLSVEFEKESTVYYGQVKKCIDGLAQICNKSATDCQKEAEDIRSTIMRSEGD